MKIRSSMYKIVFTMTVVPFLFFILPLTHLYSQRLEKIVTDSLHVVANAQVEEMKSFCEQQRNYLTMIGTTDASLAALAGELDDKTLTYFNEMLYAQVQSISYFNSITIIDTDYKVAACSEAHDFYAQSGIENLIGALGDSDFCISNVLLNKQGDRTLIAIASIQPKDTVIGYALIEISLDFYKNMRENAKLWNESTFYLLDGNTQIISAGTPDETRDHFITTKEERSDYYDKYSKLDFEQNPSGSFRYTISGKEYITYYSEVAYTDWRMMLSVNLDLYQTEQTIYFTLAGFLILLCIVLAFWISWFASKRIVAPIRLITDTLGNIRSEHDYSLRVEKRRADEIGLAVDEVNELLDFVETENLYKLQQQRLLQQRADLDALTKVLNKERISCHLEEMLEHCRANQSALAIVFIDIDDFKDFNSNYGHGVGDQVLLFLSSLLAKETGGTVGRVGGDEFLVVVDDAESKQQLEQSLKNIVSRAASTFIIRGSGIHLPISCCMGAVWVDFAQAAHQDLTAEQLIDMADSAMYHVKNNGKHGYIIKETSAI